MKMYRLALVYLMFALMKDAYGALPFPVLAQDQFAEWMTAGGDDRIILSANSTTNKYLTGPRPTTHFIARSSSTCCNPSPLGFMAAQQLFDCLRAAQSAGGAVRYFEYAMYSIRQRIKEYWAPAVKAPCAVITTPSGSDAEMIPALAALGRHQAWRVGVVVAKPLIVNIVLAGGEVGTGTPAAAGMRHFSKITPRGTTVINGECITDLSPTALEVVEIKIRDAQGNMRASSSIEEEVWSLLEKAIEQQGQIGILHMVHVCKTGYGVPSESFVRAMKQKYGKSLIVVVDAAHARMEGSVSSEWLNSGYWVMITGSKFAGGAPFSGALLIPQEEALQLAAVTKEQIPSGLGDYFTPADCDEKFENLRKVLPTWYNIGLALRWETALYEMGRFCAIESAHRDRGIARWAEGARTLIRNSKQLVLLEEIVKCADNGMIQTCIGKTGTVMAFGIKVGAAGEQKFMDMAQLRRVYELMTQDLRSRLKGLTDEESYIASLPCLTGQPVQIATAGPCTSILRIAIAAPELYKAIGHERLDPAVLIDSLLVDDQLLIQKLDLIAMHWPELSS